MSAQLNGDMGIADEHERSVEKNKICNEMTRKLGLMIDSLDKLAND